MGEAPQAVGSSAAVVPMQGSTTRGQRGCRPWAAGGGRTATSRLPLLRAAKELILASRHAYPRITPSPRTFNPQRAAQRPRWTGAGRGLRGQRAPGGRSAAGGQMLVASSLWPWLGTGSRARTGHATTAQQTTARPAGYGRPGMVKPPQQFASCSSRAPAAPSARRAGLRRLGHHRKRAPAPGWPAASGVAAPSLCPGTPPGQCSCMAQAGSPPCRWGAGGTAPAGPRPGMAVVARHGTARLRAHRKGNPALLHPRTACRRKAAALPACTQRARAGVSRAETPECSLAPLTPAPHSPLPLAPQRFPHPWARVCSRNPSSPLPTSPASRAQGLRARPPAPAETQRGSSPPCHKHTGSHRAACWQPQEEGTHCRSPQQRPALESGCRARCWSS